MVRVMLYHYIASMCDTAREGGGGALSLTGNTGVATGARESKLLQGTTALYCQD